MTVFHCYLCDNANINLVNLHAEACGIAGIEVEYHVFGVEELREQGLSPHAGHGWFIEQTLKEADGIVGFIDIDCIIASSRYVEQWTEKVKTSETVLGLAQSANHLPSRMEVYAAPAMWIVDSGVWKRVGKPSLIADHQYDTGQRLSHCLIENGHPIDLLMPVVHSKEGGSWPLGNSGSYGIGTIYDDGKVFHLFQSSKGPSYIHLLEERVEQLRAGKSVFS